MPNIWLENSDYVARYRNMEKYNIVSDVKVIAEPPSQVVQRLAVHSLQWFDLTTLAKQAILWDMGLVRTSDAIDEMTQVYTPCISSSSGVGASMATLAVPERYFKASQANATFDTCTGPGGNYTRQNNAHGLLLSKVVNCAVQYLEEQSTPNSHASMWAQDGMDIKAVPQPRFWRHEWHYPGYQSFLLFAIHTVPDGEIETKWGQCPTGESHGALIIPCTVHNPPLNWTSAVGAPDNVTWCVPQYSSAMSKWLSDISDAKSPKSQLSTTSIILFAVCGGVVIVLILFFMLYQRKKHTNDNYVRMTSAGSTEPKQTIQTASETLNAFQEDPYLCTKRLPYSSIVFGRVISHGAFGEVWIGTYCVNSETDRSWRSKRTVAIKRLLPSKRSNPHELACFADEIRLMALFTHPNIVTFIGFAWDTLQNLSCVTEFLANGDLSSYLSAHKNLEWKVKIRLGHDILKAIMYLHQMSPPVIHRDLKGKNVLVADDISAKLSDFGVSRQRQAEETMTMGVGSAFWSAPEILLDKKYDSSVDIYSFGCIMSELDTHVVPYSEMSEIMSLNLIQRITGQDGSAVPLRPKFTKTSPEWFREIASACLAHNPHLRPTIADLELQFAQELRRLESINVWEEYSF